MLSCAVENFKGRRIIKMLLCIPQLVSAWPSELEIPSSILGDSGQCLL